MFNITKKEIEWGGRTLTLETGKIARQADGAVIVTYGETKLLCTAVAAKKPKEGIDFFPLTVNYQEKAFAAGKIPGGFFKREGRPSEKETLVSRLIDRPIRPLFPAGFYNETQIITTVLTHDLENDPDIAALVGTSAALAISGIPFDGPVGAARVAFVGGEYILNPTLAQMADTKLDLVVAGTDTSVLMVESQADILTEEEMLGAVTFGHEGFQPVIKLIEEFAKEAGKERREVIKPDHSDLAQKIAKLAEKELRAAYKETDKQTRVAKVTAAKDAAIATLTEELGEEFDSLVVGKLLKGLESDIVRGDILKNGTRIDGRDTKTVRPIIAEVGILPRTHGSALFTRGETQALVVNTLGTAQDQQRIDSLEGDVTEPFMLHYNFPPFSVGEASMLRSPGRREIGHGKLAWRAIKATLPSQADFPYTIRVVSEITESNGSSSMATVCGTSLALMDSGVPVKAPVAGIAMGLIKEGDDYAVLSDILGDEDHLGDMDFKVAGTENGVTALQMDIKINGITTEIMKVALEQAKAGRIHILGEMAKALTESRGELSDFAPQIDTVKIPVDKIGALIGPGGKMIKEICETSGAKVDIEDDGTVRVAANNKEAREKAVEMIQGIIAEPEVGQIYTGPVTRLLDFGALVNFLGKHEGLCHISEINGTRIENIRDALKEGDVVKVKVIDIDRGRIRLSMRMVDQETGEDISEGMEPAPRPKSDRGDRGDRRGGRGGDRRDRDGGRGRRPRRDHEEGQADNEPNGNKANDDDNSDGDNDAPKRKTFF